MGLLGETRSPENQQPRGSCPGAPALGNPGGQGGEAAGRAKTEKLCSGPFYWPLGDLVLSFLQNSGQLPLFFSLSDLEGRLEDAFMGSAVGLGGSTH